MKETIKETVNKALNDLSLGQADFQIEHPTDTSNGDYSTNVSLIVSKAAGKNPKEVATEIVENIRKHTPKEIDRIEIAGPGFINFYLSKEYFLSKTKDILKDNNFGENDSLKNKKIIVEFTDPNPFKEFHIGHLMSNTVGESIARLAEANGAYVKRANWQGDMGRNVAIAVWGMKQGDLPDEDKTIQDKVNFLGKAYTLGSQKFEEDEGVKAEILEVNKKLFAKSDDDLNELYSLGRKWSLDYFETIYERLGTDFDYYFFESEEAERGKETVEDNISNGIFEESEGAIIYDGEKKGLHKRVFINSQGLPTYEAKELGLAQAKKERFNYDSSVVITGNEQDSYFKVILSAMNDVFPELASKTKHMSHGMMKLSSGKMSSRKGNVVTGEGIIDDIAELVEERIKDRDIENKEEVKEAVAVGAIKYSILKQSIGKDIIFDFEKSVSFEGDSGPYLQYTYTRARSILEKAKAEGVKVGEASDDWDVSELEKLLYRLPEVIKYAYSNYAPQAVVSFATEVAGAYNSFYAQSQIVDTKDPNSPYKVALTEATMNVIKKSLDVLGIKVVERM
ncbi:MAG: arginyl-tRNA synthetase [Candidatus Paceibacteria bacterium]|jgi:arginyl-tRNA synthetase